MVRAAVALQGCSILGVVPKPRRAAQDERELNNPVIQPLSSGELP